MEKFSVTDTGISGLLVIEPLVHKDKRGFFMESYSKKDFEEIGVYDEFVQDNHSRSARGVLRGLHFQRAHTQAKLVRVISGAILDVAVDLRPDSKTYGASYSVELSAENMRMLYIPKQFAHGFLTLENGTEMIYKCSDYYDKDSEGGMIWNDQILCIDWQFERYNIDEKYLNISDKDRKHPAFRQWDRKQIWR